MAEPSRKKIKGHKAPPASIMVAPDSQDDPLYFITNHPTKPCIVDLRPFADGTRTKDRAAQRGGSFKGRPTLIAEFAPVIRGICINAPSHNVDRYLQGLRAFWRLFDKHEAEFPVTSLVEINDFHGMLQRRDGVRGTLTSAFLKIVNAARSKRGMPDLYWTKNEDEPTIVDLPVRKHIALIYSDLKHRVIAARKRFDECDALAAEGKDWASTGKLRKLIPLSIADQHATYRGLLKQSKKIALSYTDIEKIGKKNESLLDSFADLATGLYPCLADTQACFLLFIAKSGWNPQTALNIDITQRYVIPHPTSAGFHIVRAIKNRGKTIQEAMGQDKSEFSPKLLLEHLIWRTQPLRDHLKAQLKDAENLFKKNPSDHSLRLRIAALNKKVRSPWLYVNPSSKEAPANALDDSSYKRSVNKSDGNTLMRSLIRGLNRRLLSANARAKLVHSNVLDFEAIDDTITVTDFRDAYAAFAYESSGYNWLMVRLALGHRSYDSTKIYLRKRRYKAEGEAKIIKLTSALLNDIEGYRLVEPAFLFFHVEKGELTEAQRQRYFTHTGRTRVGTGCVDFKKPPPEVAPLHEEGKGCRVQRCTLCRHAIVFPDSVGPLSMRLAELNALREQLSVLTWNESSFGEEHANTKEALKLFDEKDVETHLHFWSKEIAEGRHRPLDMEGSYA